MLFELRWDMQGLYVRNEEWCVSRMEYLREMCQQRGRLWHLQGKVSAVLILSVDVWEMDAFGITVWEICTRQWSLERIEFFA